MLKSRSHSAIMQVMAERKGQVFVDDRAIIVQLGCVGEPANKKPEHTLPAG